MNDYIDALIPLIIGGLCIMNASTFIKPDAAERTKKISVIRNCGWALAGIGVIFGLIEFFSH